MKRPVNNSNVEANAPPFRVESQVSVKEIRNERGKNNSLTHNHVECVCVCMWKYEPVTIVSCAILFTGE